MTDWKTDPELAALRREFTESLVQRRQVLALLIEDLADPKSLSPERLRECFETLRITSHKLAGAASTYEFPVLAAIGAGIEDRIDASERTPEAFARLAPFATLLDEALVLASKGNDPVALAGDERYRRLTSADG